MYQAKAHNEVPSDRDKWENGVYAALDKVQPYKHGSEVDQFGILKDSDEGSIGLNGIIRAKSFYTSYGDKKEGMGIHAGRIQLDFLKRYTLGCLRVESDFAMSVFALLISFDPLETIEVTNNLRPVEVIIDESQFMINYWINPDNGEPEIWE